MIFSVNFICHRENKDHHVMYKIRQRICIKGKKTHLLKHTALSASPKWSKYKNRKCIIPTNIFTYFISIPFASVSKGKNGSYALNYIHEVQWNKHLYLRLCNVYFPKIENNHLNFVSIILNTVQHHWMSQSWDGWNIADTA